MKKSLHYLRDEYPQNKEPQTLNLNGKEYVVPFHYVKNSSNFKQAFITDFLDFAKKDGQRYAKNKVSMRKVSWNDGETQYLIPVPYALHKKEMLDSEIVSYIFKRAERKYKQAVSATRKLKKAYSHEDILTNISSEELHKMRKRYRKYVTFKVKDNTVATAILLGEFLARGIKKSPKNNKGILPDKLKAAVQRYGTKALIGTAVLATGLGVAKLVKETLKDKVETVNDDPYGNVKTFNKVRDEIKVMLAFVENFSSTAFPDGEGVMTIGYGCTYTIDENGVGNRKISPITKDMTMSMEEALVQKDRYLDYRILPQIKNLIKVPMDEETTILTTAFSYVIGPSGFKKSDYLKALNDGVKGEELFRHTTGWRKQQGLLKRNYFGYLRATNAISTADILDLPAEGCYSLEVKDCCPVNKKGAIKKDKEGLSWFKSDSTSIANNIKLASKPRVSKQLGPCKKVREILPPELVKQIEKNRTAKFSILQAKSNSR